MKATTVLKLLALFGVANACGGGNDKEWTKEELDELEAKWGFEVR